MSVESNPYSEAVEFRSKVESGEISDKGYMSIPTFLGLLNYMEIGTEKTIFSQHECFQNGYAAAERKLVNKYSLLECKYHDVIRLNEGLNMEIVRLKEEIEALTHEGRQGELEQANVDLATESEELRQDLERQRKAWDQHMEVSISNARYIFELEMEIEALKK